MDLVLVGGGRKWPVFFMRAANRLVFVWASRLNWFVWVVDIDLISVWGVELDLISVWWSELICFMSGGRKRLGFSVWIESDLDFVWWCSTANIYMASWTDRWVGYVLEDCWLRSSVVYPSEKNKRDPGFKCQQGWPSVSVVLSVINEQRSVVQIPPKS